MPMLTPQPGEGLVANLNLYRELKTALGTASFYDVMNQNVINQGELKPFLARADKRKDRNEVRFSFVENAGDPERLADSRCLPTSPGVRQVDDFERAVREWLALADAPSTTGMSRQVVEGFRLPSPRHDPQMYRIIGPTWRRKLVVLWGCESKEGTSLPPMEAIAELRTYLKPAWRRWLERILALLLLFLLLLCLLPGCPDDPTNSSKPDPSIAKPVLPEAVASGSGSGLGGGGDSPNNLSGGQDAGRGPGGSGGQSGGGSGNGQGGSGGGSPGGGGPSASGGGSPGRSGSGGSGGSGAGGPGGVPSDGRSPRHQAPGGGNGTGPGGSSDATPAGPRPGSVPSGSPSNPGSPQPGAGDSKGEIIPSKSSTATKEPSKSGRPKADQPKTPPTKPDPKQPTHSMGKLVLRREPDSGKDKITLVAELQGGPPLSLEITEWKVGGVLQTSKTTKLELDRAPGSYEIFVKGRCGDTVYTTTGTLEINFSIQLKPGASPPPP